VVVRGVLFDMDDTLFDYSGAEEAGILAHLVAEGQLAWFDSAANAVAVWREIAMAVYTRFMAGEITFLEHRGERARRFLATLGWPAHGGAGPDAEAWFDRYHRHFEAAWAAFPDVPIALSGLAPHVRLGVVSNSAQSHQEHKLRALGLRERFSCVVCSDEAGVAKPDPRIFHAGCVALGLPPEEVLYVGDSLTADALGARAAGLHGVWLDRRGRGGAPADVTVISSLAQLPALLADGWGGEPVKA
jgi:putative hydrolase of the HAD superfamily